MGQKRSLDRASLRGATSFKLHASLLFDLVQCNGNEAKLAKGITRTLLYRSDEPSKNARPNPRNRSLYDLYKIARVAVWKNYALSGRPQ
jgi:methyl coenzyme M reductase beta subunit